MKLKASIIVDEGVGELAQSHHLVVVEESTFINVFTKVDLHTEALLPPVQHSEMTLRARQHKTTPVSGIVASIIAHGQLQIECIGCGLDVDCFLYVLLFDFDCLVALVLWFQESRLEIMKQEI